PRRVAERREREPHLVPRPPPRRRDEGARLRTRHLLPLRARRGRRGGGRDRGGGDARRRGDARRGGDQRGTPRGRHRGRRRSGGRSRRVSGASVRRILALVLAATVDRAGPLRDKLVPLADGLADLSKDGVAYADGGDPASFARVLADVTAGWQRLRELTAALPKDDGLDGTIARGISYVVAAKSEKRSIVTAGPF